MADTTKSSQAILNRIFNATTSTLSVFPGGDSSVVDTTQHKLNIKRSAQYTVVTASGMVAGSDTGLNECCGFMVIATGATATFKLQDGINTVYPAVALTSLGTGGIVKFKKPINFSSGINVTFSNTTGSPSVAVIWR